MLSRKHYNRIAAIIAETYKEAPSYHEKLSICQLARQLSEYFEEDNERFDSERFWHACFGDE